MKNDAKPRHELTRAPAALLRALASRLDRCATSDGSGADVRTTDRCVATCCVEVHELVALGALEPPAVDQLLQTLPLVRVRQHVRVEVHAPTPRLTRVEEIALPDGRRAQLWTGGVASAPAVLVCHGTPDTRWIARTGASAAASAGLRLGCVNRPGYGTSTPTDSRMSSVADDAVAVLDRLDVDRVGVLGMSVGGAYAAALAARHPDRVAALAVVAAPRETRSATGALDAEVERARPEFAQWAAGVNAADPTTPPWLRAGWASLPTDDGALLGAEISAADIAASVREALACHDGYLRDAALLVSDWGFALSDVRCPPRLLVRRRRPAQPTRDRPVVGRPIEGTDLTVTPTTHLATLLANWRTILAALRRHPRLTAP